MPTSKPGAPWLPLERISSLFSLEPILVVAGMGLFAWIFYKLLLRKLTAERHRSIHRHFFALLLQFSLAVLMYGAAETLLIFTRAEYPYDRIVAYTGLVGLFALTYAFIRASRLILLEILFLSHMREGVPLLLVNIFTLVLSMIGGTWLLYRVFEVSLAPLLATSAIFSVVLGLALQDTLGNLFAGISLQLDRAYEIGDWVEIQSPGIKWAGQVREITWRATVLIGVGEEIVILPNRVVAQAQVSNFSTKSHGTTHGVFHGSQRPFVRTHNFRLRYGTNIEKAKQLLAASATGVDGVRADPKPQAYLTEAHDSGLSLRVVYFIEDYGSQVSVADRVQARALVALAAAGLEPAPPRLSLTETYQDKSPSSRLPLS